MRHTGWITRIVDTRRSFTPPADWDAERHLRRGLGMFRGGEDVLVEVEFDRYQERYARERTFHPTQRRKELRDGRRRVTFETTEAALEQAARWLLQYGEHARALQPAALRVMMREHLKRTAALYEQAPNEAEFYDEGNYVGHRHSNEV